MLKELWMAHKTAIWIVMGVLAVLFFLIFRGSFSTQTPVELSDEPVPQIVYCGVAPTELCIMSFGRDLDRELIIHLFVPDQDFPDFYLEVERASGIHTYECIKNKEIFTSVYCTGETINLNERIEINLMSKEDDRLLATGNLVLAAILISPQIIITETIETPFVDGDTTATATSPTVSYPGPSYP